MSRMRMVRMANNKQALVFYLTINNQGNFKIFAYYSAQNTKQNDIEFIYSKWTNQAITVQLKE